MWNTDFPANRADVDDPPGFFRTHRRQHSEDRIERTPEMCLHRELEILMRHHFQRTDLNDARVVHEHVYRAEASIDGRDHSLHVLLVGDIAGNDHDFGAEFFKIETRLIELLFVARAKHESGAFARELASHHEAESSRAAGD